MISNSEISKIRTLHKSGLPVAKIAEILHRSLPSIYKYLKEIKKNSQSEVEDAPKDIPSKIVPYIENIDHKLKSGMLNNSKIFKEVKSVGYKGSYGLLNRYLQDKRHEKTTESVRAYQKIETDPGEQAQVDWGHFGKINVENKMVNLYIFVYVLSYSRAMYAEFTTSQRQQVWQNCHINAFEKLGVAKKLRYDNLKTVVISREKMHGVEKINYNFDFMNFARHYKFEPEACPRYYPRAKGKVEAGVKYLRNNFMSGEVFKKSFKSLDELNVKLEEWLQKTANNRIHSTTKLKPKDL